MMGRFRLWLVVLVLAGAIAAGVGWLTRPEPMDVTVARVAPGLVEATVSNTRAGTIEACRRAGISPRLGGQIESMPVRAGDRVIQGQILMTFWSDDLAARADLARSELDSSAARADQACVLSDVARREARRQSELALRKLGSEGARDQAEGDARAKAAACAAARSVVEVSRANLEVALAALDQTLLKAPFAGVVAEVNGEVGEFVTPSPIGIPTPPAVDLMDVSCLYVSAPIDEVDAPRIRVGMDARISLDAFRAEVFAGKVRRIAPYVLDREKQARTVDVEVEFADPHGCDCMLPGYSADVEVVLEVREGVLRIPTEAILQGPRVFVVDAGDRAEARTIEVGLGNWAWTEVRAGLVAEEQVVRSVDREELRAGRVIRPLPAADAPE